MKKFKIVLLGSLFFSINLILNPLTINISNAKDKIPERPSIGSISIGGTFHVIATGWAEMLNRKLNLNLSVEVTGGARHNLELVENEKTTFGFSGVNFTYQGLHGLEWAKGKKYENTRILMALYPNFLTGWTISKKGIKSYRDLNNISFSPGPAGSMLPQYADTIFKLIGAKPSKIVHLGWESVVQQMKDGLLDSAGCFCGTPHPTPVELAVTKDINIFGILNEDGKNINQQFPFFIKSEIPVGIYKNQTAPIPSLSTWIVMIANKNLPQDYVYKIVKTTFECQKEELMRIHPTLSYAIPQAITSMVTPVHLGAIRYYKEVGITVPQEIIPKD